MSLQHSLESPLFSVVVPVHNKEKSLSACLSSVLAQTIRDLELIVIDDGSTDLSATVAGSMNDPRLKLIVREHRGKSFTRNEGIQRARADLVALLDADDEWMPNFLEAISRLMRAYPDAGVYATAIAVDKGWARYRLPVHGLPSHPWAGIIHNYYATTNSLTSSSVVVRKCLFNRAGLFNVNLNTAEDRDMWFRLAAYSNIAYTTEVQAVWHYSGDNHASKSLLPCVPSGMYVSLATISSDNTLGEKTKAAANLYAANMVLRESALLVARGSRPQARAALSDWRHRHGLSLGWVLLRLITELPKTMGGYCFAMKRLVTGVISVSLSLYRGRQKRDRAMPGV